MKRGHLLITAFAALVLVTAALAQSLDGLDLARIKAAAEAQRAEAEAFVDGMAGREGTQKADAEALRATALAHAASLDPQSLPQGPDGPVDFDALLAGAANAKGEPQDAPLFIVFASLSIPKPSLEALIRDTARAGGLVVFRGFPNNSASAFAAGLSKVVQSEDEEAHLGIDPRLFRAFQVDAVPAFVIVSRDYDLCDGFDCKSQLPPHELMRGNVSVDYALDSFASGNGPGARVAAVALANLRRER